MREIIGDMNREFVRQTSEFAANESSPMEAGQVEAKHLENVTHALDLIEDIAESVDAPIRLINIRQIHRRLFNGHPEVNPGEFRNDEALIQGATDETTQPLLIDWHMGALIDWLGKSSDSSRLNAVAIAAAAHTDIAQIHPFKDGNGRIARLVMNLILRRAGYPIAIITRNDRERYYDALSHADHLGDLTKLISFLIEVVSTGLIRFENAAEEQRRHDEMAQQIAELIARPEIPRLRDKYEVWKGAFESLQSKFDAMVKDVDRRMVGGRVFIRLFDMVEFEQFADLYTHKPSQRTWFFRIAFERGNTVARYLFTFRWSDYAISQHSPISLRLGREETPYKFVWLDEVTRPNVPRIHEIAYSVDTGKFAFLDDKQRVQESNEDDIVKRFFGEVIRCHFQN